MSATRQLSIVHLSDIHFGETHRFDPPRTAAGDRPREPRHPTLLDSLVADLAEDDPGCPVLFALTGDLAQTGSFAEFKQSEEFVRGLAGATTLGRPRGTDAVFMVAGNHDVLFTSADREERWQQWKAFCERVRGTGVDLDGPLVHDRVDDLGAIVVTLNSSIYVERDEPDETRGRVDVAQLTRLRDELRAIDTERLESSIRVALIHHHPVLIPDLVEPNRGYDAVHDSARLLTILRRFGFHVILHGHKHNPHVFIEEATSAYRAAERHPLLIVAGGSVGSTELPDNPQCGNCYNRVVVKWNPDADQTRICVTTRGLCRFDEDGTELLPGSWYWDTLRVDDRQFVGDRVAPAPRDFDWRTFDAERDRDAEDLRVREYARMHGYFPVVEVMPSLEAGQVNEARVWIVSHRPVGGTGRAPDLRRVRWSAGPKFPVIEVTAEQDPNFCATLHYWGPFLIQAHLEFANGESADAHVYARLPGSPAQPAEAV